MIRSNRTIADGHVSDPISATLDDVVEGVTTPLAQLDRFAGDGL